MVFNTAAVSTPSAAQGTAGTGRGTAADRHNWSVLARETEKDLAKSILNDPSKAGVVITGDAGVGKSSMAGALVTDLGATHLVLHLRNSSATANTPYGGLGFLLARLPRGSADSPTAVLHGVAALLKADAGDRPVVLVVDNAGSLDEMSTGVVMHLLLTRSAKMVALCQNTADLPPDFHWLLQEGQLGSVTLHNLSLEQTKQVLSAILGGPVSAGTAAGLHTASGGNPFYLQSLVVREQGGGNLALKGSVWTLREPIAQHNSGGVEELFRGRWARQAPEAREVIEMLSLARHVSLNELAMLYGADIVADMEDEGTIVVDHSDRHWVSLREPYFGDAVRGWLPTPRRRELFARLLGAAELSPETMSDRDLLGYVAWSQDCGVEVSPELALAAVEAAVRLLSPALAIKHAESIDASAAEWFPAQLRRAEALLLLEQPREALSVLDEAMVIRPTGLPDCDYVDYVVIRCRVLSWIPDSSESIPALLHNARLRMAECLDEAGTVDSGKLLHARNALELAELDYLCFVGDYAAAVPRLERAYQEPGETDEEFRLRCGIALIGGWCITGREMDALALAAEIGAVLKDEPELDQLYDEFLGQYFAALMLTGRWQQCVAILQNALEDSAGRLQFFGGVAEMSLGLTYVYAGRGQQALGPLLSGIAQLELRPTRNILIVAYAATAFAYAQTGNHAQAYKYLELMVASPGPTSWQTQSAASFCGAMARRWLGDPAAKARLLASARQDIDAGRWTTAGISLLGATVPGTEEEFRLIEEVAAHRQGPLAELGRLVALGSRTKKAKVLLEAGEAARALSLDAVEARCMALAVDYARDAGDVASARVAQTRLDALSRVMPALPVAPRTGAPLLTARERQVARLAGRGSSNKEIAAQIGVSIRTVEGHLYQVFTKLGVASRSDLVDLV
ncbi:helix-turn-helix transcriptional regulator [Paenarthrobacter sp. DKR-5]|uniref:LuxR C-terminal-related transcriptional regulator n=1 Tax=Paenarthrobacter sp. DKR-5 TaxID=2835535 RepID=UPI001BDCE51C|nr:LuxR C-terminal-related transcriptional regulator [Paenarthrobacter sp. DKR-5]MBT1002455.1 helix-turn-helix transcriptional regulator [Paenarthrobacter sp. DKR-5]